jgi:hypothetical protein
LTLTEHVLDPFVVFAALPVFIQLFETMGHAFRTCLTKANLLAFTMVTVLMFGVVDYDYGLVRLAQGHHISVSS